MPVDDNNALPKPSNSSDEKGIDILKVQLIFAHELYYNLKGVYPGIWEKMHENKTLHKFVACTADKYYTILLDKVQERLISISPEEFMGSILEFRMACLIELLKSIEIL